MTYLLDVNVLIALVDQAHVGHDDAHAWFEAEGQQSWATCPLTENGLLRIVSHPKYPNMAGSPARVAEILEALRALPGHVFWTDDISLVASDLVEARQILTSAQVTDSYLLALAASRGGRLATFDRRLSVKAVRGGRDALAVISP